MRTYDDYRRILELWEQGHNKLQISQLTGIPRATVRDCIARFGSVNHLIESHNTTDLPLNISFDQTRKILTLWEQGRSKTEIMAITGFSKYMVTRCIEQYRTVAQLDEQQSGAAATPAAHKVHRKAANRNLRTFSDEELVAAVRASVSYAETLRALGIRPAGGNYATIKMRISELGLDTSHFRGKGWLKGERSAVITHRPLDEILVENSTYSSTNNLRKRLLAEGLLERRCASCALETWLGQPIPLEVDHINGDRRDNRLDNLRLLCPNCHALTPTYRGKNKSANAVI